MYVVTYASAKYGTDIHLQAILYNQAFINAKKSHLKLNVKLPSMLSEHLKWSLTYIIRNELKNKNSELYNDK